MKDLQQQPGVPLSRHLSNDSAKTEDALFVEMNAEIVSLRNENEGLLKENERLTTSNDETQLRNNRLLLVQEDLFKQIDDISKQTTRMQTQMQAKLQAVTNHAKETEVQLQEKIKNQQMSISSLFNDLTASRALVEELQKKLSQQQQTVNDISKRNVESENASEDNSPMSIEFSAGDVDFPDDMSDDGSVMSHGSFYSHFSTKSEMIPHGRAVGGRGLVRQSSLRSVGSVDQADFLKGVIDNQSLRGRAGKMLFGSSAASTSGASVCSDHNAVQMDRQACSLEEENAKLRSALVKMQTQHKEELYKNQKTIQGLKQANEVILHKNRYISNTAPIKRRSSSFTAPSASESPSAASDASSSPSTPAKSITTAGGSTSGRPSLGRSNSLKRISDFKQKRLGRSSSFRRGLQEEDEDTFRPPTRGNRLTKLVEEENEGGDITVPSLRRTLSLQPTMITPPESPSTPKTTNTVVAPSSPTETTSSCDSSSEMERTPEPRSLTRSKSLQPNDYRSLCNQRREAAMRLLEHASHVGDRDDLASKRLSSTSQKEGTSGGAIRSGLRRWWRKD